MTNQVLVSRKKNTEKQSTLINSDVFSTSTEDFNNIVIMSGTAKRKPLEKKENRFAGPTPKSDFKGSFSKLRAPFTRPHQKHPPTGERLMTKSCEVLFECIKPYKDIRMGRKTHAKESIRTIGSVLTTDIIYERKATRKVQFFSFTQDNPFPANNHSQVLTAEFEDEKFHPWGLTELPLASSANRSVMCTARPDPQNGIVRRLHHECIPRAGLHVTQREKANQLRMKKIIS